MTSRFQIDENDTYRLKLNVVMKIMENVRVYPRDNIESVGDLEERMVPRKSRIEGHIRGQVERWNSAVRKENGRREDYRTMLDQLDEIDDEDWEDVVYRIIKMDYDIVGPDDYL